MFFPGDPEFTWENYAQLPYPYVVNAYQNGHILNQERLHDLERPTALLTALTSNKGKDPRKNKLNTYLDMSFYKPRDTEASVDAAYGSAMLEMAKRGMLPSWTLFCFKEVTASADSSYKPETLALVAEDAVLLHPQQTPSGWEGMLIARESASLQEREFVSDTGQTVVLTVPLVHTKVICEEGVILTR